MLTGLLLGLVPLGAQTSAPAPTTTASPAAKVAAPSSGAQTSVTQVPAAAIPPAAKSDAPSSGAQTPPAPASAGTAAPKDATTLSVWDGVYSTEQASRGTKAFNSLCARCHGENLLGGEDSPALVDNDFLDKWQGKSVGALIEHTRKTMPSDGPGKLSRQQCTDITAYLLNANGFPVGKSELGPDPDAQNLILIEAKKETPSSAPTVQGLAAGKSDSVAEPKSPSPNLSEAKK